MKTIGQKPAWKAVMDLIEKKGEITAEDATSIYENIRWPSNAHGRKNTLLMLYAMERSGWLMRGSKPDRFTNARISRGYVPEFHPDDEPHDIDPNHPFVI